MKAKTRILIADDHKMFAEGIRYLLEDDFDLVGIVGDGQTMIEEAERLNPAVILVDVSMPVLNGLDAVRQLKKKGTTAKVIFLTMHDEHHLLAEAFRCGASGYVLKQSASVELICAIEQVLTGRKYVTPVMRDIGSPDHNK